MVGTGPLSVGSGALTAVGAVLAEAMILYVVYGAATAALGDKVVDLLAGG
ncbi:MAG: hypothetical protein ABEK02_09320 [Haloquadratum sp.]